MKLFFVKRILLGFLIIPTSLALFPHKALAEVRDASLAAPVSTDTAENAVVVAATPTPVSTNINGLLNNTAGEQKSAAKTGAKLAAAFGAAAVVCWAATHPYKSWCKALAAAAVGSALVAAHNSGKSSGNSVTACEFVAGGCGATTTGGSASTGTSSDGSADNGNGNSGAAMTANEALRSTASTLQKAGVQVDYAKKEITGPDGKTVALSALSSPDSMASAGLNPSDFNKLKDMAEKIQKDKSIPNSAEGVDSDSITVGSKSSAETMGGYAGPAGSSEARLGLSRDPAQVAGLKAMFNGEPIGVAADSIFGIIDRRYELHQKQGSFLLSK
jgi:hypothetical protein